jgi:transposase InsO family protein
VKYAFIDQHRSIFPINVMCRVLNASRSGFYDWEHREPSARAQENAQLVARLRHIHVQSRESYGVVKAWQALKQQGVACGRNRVAALRARHDIYARRRRRFIATTRSRRAPGAPNLLDQKFHAAHPNRIWTTDVTFIATRQGWLFLAVMIDLFSRKVVGWSMSNRNNRELARNCLLMSVEQRNPPPGLIHHSDQGVAYTASEWRELMEQHGMISSMSRRGNCWDNAVAESFFGQLKNELICGQVFKSTDEARSAIFDYIEVFYNRQRLHQTLGYITPDQFEMMTVA